MKPPDNAIFSYQWLMQYCDSLFELHSSLKYAINSYALSDLSYPPKRSFYIRGLQSSYMFIDSLMCYNKCKISNFE